MRCRHVKVILKGIEILGFCCLVKLTKMFLASPGMLSSCTIHILELGLYRQRAHCPALSHHLSMLEVVTFEA
jgi:hypothetical protein